MVETPDYPDDSLVPCPSQRSQRFNKALIEASDDVAQKGETERVSRQRLCVHTHSLSLSLAFVVELVGLRWVVPSHKR